MHQAELHGSYEAMGRQQAPRLRGWDLPKPDPRMLSFARQCEEIMAEHATELLDEIRGLSEAAELDYDALLTFTVTAPFEPSDLAVSSCTVLAVAPERTVDGRPIVGRNYDFFHDVSKEAATTFYTYPEEQYASLGNCDIWVGREDGLNEAGLFVGIARAFLPGLQPGLTFWFFPRLLLDRCSTVDEGLKLLSEIPHAASWTYLLADSTGQAAVVEPTVQGVEVRYPEDGLLVMTNHAVCSAWAGQERFVPPDSHARYNRLRQLLGQKDMVDTSDVKRALRDHDGLVCSHGAHFPERRFGTLRSVVGCLGERQLEIAAGQPCEAEYQTLNF